MAFQIEDIHAEVEIALQKLADQRGDEFAASIKIIIHTNLNRNRMQYYLGENIHRVPEYIDKVVLKYIELSSFMNELQVKRTDQVWKPLTKRLHIWAYNFFVRKGFYKSLHTQEIASECANEAALLILDAYYPYDTDFAPWAHVIVQNTCRKYIRNSLKKNVIPEQNLVELTDSIIVEDDPAIDNQKKLEKNKELLDALAKLSVSRRRVIELHYFEDMPLPEIAKEMKKSVSAIHSLHFNALQELRKILDENGNINK